MAWLYLPFLESNFSPESECSAKDFEQLLTTWAAAIAVSVTLNGKFSPQASWRRACKKALWMKRLSGLTLPPSTAENGVEKWIASLPDSHARTCLSQGVETGLTAHAQDCSLRFHGSPTIAVRGSSFWRTSQASLLPPPPLWTRKKASSKNALLPESWETWPTAGGMRSGSLFQRPMWAPATAGRDGSASRGETWLTPHGMSGMEKETGRSGAGGEFAKQATQWSTPDVCSGARDMSKIDPDAQKCANTKRTTGLPTEVTYWMTPNVPNGGRSVSAELVASKGTTETGEKRTVGLESQTRHWATPTSNEHTGAGHPTSKQGGENLRSQVDSWPTPATRDHNGANSSQHMNRTDGRTDGAGTMPTNSRTL